MIYHLNYPTGFLSDLWLLTHLQVSNDSVTTWRPAGEAQRTPLRRVHCRGNNSATFHHFIFISLYWAQLRTHEPHEGKDRKWTTKRKRREGERRLSGKLEEAGVLKRGEVWIMKFKKKRYHTTTVSSPPMRQTKNKLIRQKTEQNWENQTENQTHALSVSGTLPM